MKDMEKAARIRMLLHQSAERLQRALLLLPPGAEKEDLRVAQTHLTAVARRLTPEAERATLADVQPKR